MLDAMVAGVENIHNIPLKSEGHGTNLHTIWSTLAITDAISALNHLNQFLGLEQLPFAETTMKRDIVKSVRLLRMNQVEYVATLNDTIDNLVGVRPREEYFKLDAIIRKILNDLTKAGRMMAKPIPKGNPLGI